MKNSGLLSEIRQKEKKGLIDYRWKIRVYLSGLHKQLNPQDRQLLDESVSPFVYLKRHQTQIAQDPSLSAVCQLCTSTSHVMDVNRRDPRLLYLSRLFNRMVHSDRALLMCYDCGTVARGVFFQLLKTYRNQQLRISRRELQQIQDQYYMDRYVGNQGVIELSHRIHSTNRNSLFLCAMQLGEDFGHIYVIEKIYLNRSRPRYRIYQSCHQAYLLIDYIESMNYARGLSSGIEIEAHLTVLNQLIGTPSWKPHDVQDFIEWFKFMPPSGTKPNDRKLFTFASLVL